jgi:hypothetical protein
MNSAELSDQQVAAYCILLIIIKDNEMVVGTGNAWGRIFLNGKTCRKEATWKTLT